MNAMTPTEPEAQTQPCFDARAMLGASSTGQIVLDNQVYTLRITRSGKLILTK